MPKVNNFNFLKKRTLYYKKGDLKIELINFPGRGAKNKNDQKKCVEK